MPCFLMSYHGKGTWMPDRPRGYVKRKQGILPPDPEEAHRYRQLMKSDTVRFIAEMQRICIEETLVAAEKQGFRVHYVATDPSHIHALVSWTDDKGWMKVRTGLKTSLPLRLTAEFKHKPWFSAGSSRKQVRDRDHFNHLVTRYLPDHRGRKWCEHKGWIE